MKESVYIETSIFSFYHDARTSAAVTAMREWTHAWWGAYRQRYDVATSTAVIAELDRGGLAHRQRSHAMALTVPAVPVDEAIEEIVEAYISHHVMPRDPLGDALHLALASYNKFDHLLTWNCDHLANANKFGHIRRVNAILGLHTPNLVTPLELMGLSEEEADDRSEDNG
jgi:hypothetical protein